MKKTIISGLMLCSAIAMQAVEPGEEGWQNLYFIEPGAKWEVEVKSNTNPDEPTRMVTEWLDEEPVQVNDNWYLKLWVQIENEDPEFTTYIRLDTRYSCIYAMDPQNMERGEMLIYIMHTNSNLEEEPLTALNWEGSLSEESYSFSLKRGSFGVESCGNLYSGQSIEIYPAGSEKTTENCLGEVQWYYGLGSLSGFTNQCYAINNDYTTTLRRMTTLCSGIVYESPEAPTPGTNGIDSIEDDATQSAGVRYHIDGTLFRDGEKGIYIMNGKKYIAR